MGRLMGVSRSTLSFKVTLYIKHRTGRLVRLLEVQEEEQGHQETVNH